MSWKILAANMELVFGASIVVFGAIVHATAQLKMAREKKEIFTIADFLILWIIALFSGVMFGLLANWFFEGELTPILLFAGTGSFLGLVGINKLANFVVDLLMVKYNDKKNER